MRTAPVFRPPVLPSPGTTVTAEITMREGEGDVLYTPPSTDLNPIRDSIELRWETLLPSEASEIEDFMTALNGTGRFFYRVQPSHPLTLWICKELVRTYATPQSITARFEQRFDAGLTPEP